MYVLCESSITSLLPIKVIETVMNKGNNMES